MFSYTDGAHMISLKHTHMCFSACTTELDASSHFSVAISGEIKESKRTIFSKSPLSARLPCRRVWSAAMVSCRAQSRGWACMANVANPQTLNGQTLNGEF